MLRVLTYNIQRSEGTDRKMDPHRIAEVIRETGADIVGLNEVYHPVILPGAIQPILDEIAQELGMNYIYGAALPILPISALNAQYGDALLSRYPMSKLATFRLPAPEAMESRSLVSAEVALGPGQRLTCYVTHLDHVSEEVRLAQVEHLLEIIARLPSHPHIIMGDFNALAPGDYEGQPERLAALRNQARRAHMAWPEPRVVPRMLQAGYLDAQGTVCQGPRETWSTPSPAVRIDYIWLSPDLRSALRACQRWDTPLAQIASDHFPVLATLDMGFSDK